MQAEEIFELVLRKAQGCKNNDTMNSYLLITLDARNEYVRSVLSYTELYNILNPYIQDFLAFPEFADQIEQLPNPDSKYLEREINQSNCITHAAVCLPLGPCLLSDYEDPLLLALYELNSIVTMIYESMLPDMKFKSVYYNKDMLSFNIEPISCYWYAKCAFVFYDEPIYNRELYNIGLEKTRELGEQVISSINQNELLESTLSSPVFLCYASGECNLFSLTELYKNVLLAAANKILKYDYLLRWNLNYKDLRNKLVRIQEYKEAIYIYMNQNGEVILYPRPFYSSDNPIYVLDDIFGTLFHKFSLPTRLYTKIQEQPGSTGCQGPKNTCAYLGMRNKIINHTMSEEIQSKLQRRGKYATCGSLPLFADQDMN